MQSVVSRWFGAGFEQLHPLLQALPLHGGVLAGPIEITLGQGLARPFGCAIVRKLEIPLQAGPHTGCGSKSATYPNVCSGIAASTIASVWIPPSTLSAHGRTACGTGPVRLGLGVEVIDGGWY